jgi:hypothetical protein
MGEQKRLSQEQVGWVLDRFAAGERVGRIAEDLEVDPELVDRAVREYVMRNRDEDPTRAGLANLGYQVAQLRDELDGLRREVRASKPDLEAVANRLLAKTPSTADWRKAFAYDRSRMEPTEQRAREIRDAWLHSWPGLEEWGPQFAPSVTLVGSVDGYPYQVPVSAAEADRLAGLVDGQAHQIVLHLGEIVDFKRQGDLLWVFHHVRGRTISFEVPFKFRAPAASESLVARLGRELGGHVEVDREAKQVRWHEGGQVEVMQAVDWGNEHAVRGEIAAARHRMAVRRMGMTPAHRPGEIDRIETADGQPVGVRAEQPKRDERSTVAISVRSDPDALARLGLTVADVDALARRGEGR